MANVNDTVRDLIVRYPCSYGNRMQALHQILVVLGSGYGWRDGEPVTRFQEAEDCTALHARSKYSEEFLAELAEFDVDEARVTGRCPKEHFRSHASGLAQEPGSLARDPYPPTYSSLLLTVPDDVKPDWAAAVSEIASMVAPSWAGDRSTDEELRMLTPKQRDFIARHAA
ncbi:hypothetical protein [Streptomyces goshikiensis]|uniref:hypothetical protein n=1 Tax=Streptomyces goshikiensis TaxID=1942 RepID=UPI00368595F3